MDNAIAESGSEKKQWSFEVSEKVGDTTKRTCVRKVENGYIVRITKEWKEGNDYKWEEKEYISKENPIPKLTKKEETQEETSALENFFDSVGGGLINVD